ncbi:unnamed protein product [Amoebophrya sp. A120]|nr:unnamed protein product [Amoebophrya sp. A120]|eukprot:GSA120T00014603001.1
MMLTHKNLRRRSREYHSAYDGTAPARGSGTSNDPSNASSTGGEVNQISREQLGTNSGNGGQQLQTGPLGLPAPGSSTLRRSDSNSTIASLESAINVGIGSDTVRQSKIQFLQSKGIYGGNAPTVVEAPSSAEQSQFETTFLSGKQQPENLPAVPRSLTPVAAGTRAASRQLTTGPGGAPLPGSKPHLDSLDGCRFLLVLPIIIGHFIPAALATARHEKQNQISLPLLKFLTHENVIVGGFFLLSGYVSGYTGSKLGERVHEVEKLKNRESYFFQRVMTYYPLHLLLTTMFSPMFLYLDRYVYNISWRKTLFQMFLNFALLQAWFPSAAEIYNPPTWFLSAWTFSNLTLPGFVIPQIASLSKKSGLAKLRQFLTSVNILQKFAYAYSTGRVLLSSGKKTAAVDQLREQNPMLWNVTRFHPIWALLEICLGVVAAREVMLDDVEKDQDGDNNSSAGSNSSLLQPSNNAVAPPSSKQDVGHSPPNSSASQADEDFIDAIERRKVIEAEEMKEKSSTNSMLQQLLRKIKHLLKKECSKKNPLFYYFAAHAALLLRLTDKLALNGTLVRSVFFLPLYAKFLQQLHKDHARLHSAAVLKTTPTTPGTTPAQIQQLQMVKNSKRSCGATSTENNYSEQAEKTDELFLFTKFLSTSKMKHVGSLAFPMFMCHGPIGQLFYKKAIVTKLFSEEFRLKYIKNTPKRFFLFYLLLVTVSAHVLQEGFLKNKMVIALVKKVTKFLASNCKGMLGDNE